MMRRDDWRENVYPRLYVVGALDGPLITRATCFDMCGIRAPCDASHSPVSPLQTPEQHWLERLQSRPSGRQVQRVEPGSPVQ